MAIVAHAEYSNRVEVDVEAGEAGGGLSASHFHLCGCRCKFNRTHESSGVLSEERLLPHQQENRLRKKEVSISLAHATSHCIRWLQVGEQTIDGDSSSNNNGIKRWKKECQGQPESRVHSTRTIEKNIS